MDKMDKDVFDRTYTAQLNPQQREAVHAVDGAVLLLAVPGSGKTTVLVTRLGYMLCCCGIAADRVLTMTYTTAATKEMKQRFSALFGKDCPQIPEFRTINGVSAKIIDYYARTHGSGQAFALEEDEGKLTKLVSELYRELSGEYATPGIVKELRRRITYVKNMMLDEVEIGAQDTGFEQFPALYSRYCAELKKQRKMDYDDQMIYAKTILERYEDVLSHFQRCFPYICVDESQDTSRIQHAIIRLLAQKSGNLFMVGDEDQSIYGFRAAYPEALTEFEQTYPRARVLLIEENYRSTPEILRPADAFIQKNHSRYPKTIRPTRASGAPVHLICAKDRAAQYEWLAHEATLANAQTAVLYRNNDSVLPLIDLLERKHIPYRCRQMDGTFFTHRVVADITDMIRFAQDTRNAECFLRIYSKFGIGISKKAAEYACEKSGRFGTPILQELMQAPMLSSYVKNGVADLIELLPYLLQDTAACGLRRIWRELHYADYVERNKLDSGKYDLLCLLAERETGLNALLERLSYLHRVITEPSAQPTSGLLLSTIHSAKGLEFDTVYLLDVLDGILPALTEPQSEAEQRQYEEERRLFYVAMTRAKNDLFLFACSNQGSAFIREVQQDLPREMPAEGDVFYALSTGLCGKSYDHATKGRGVIAADCEGRCMIAYPTGKTQIMTLGCMYEQRAIIRKLPEKTTVQTRRSDEKAAAKGGKMSASFRPKPERKLTSEEKAALIAKAAPGRKVRHTSFGVGSVVGLQLPVITVDFPAFGVKKLAFFDSVQHELLYFDEA